MPKFTATKERRREREEFVYKYAGEIGELYASYDISEEGSKQRIKTFIDSVVRKEIEYNLKTDYISIFLILIRTFERLMNKYN